MKKLTFAIALISLLLVGCSQDEGIIENKGELVALNYKVSLGNSVQSRATGDLAVNKLLCVTFENGQKIKEETVNINNGSATYSPKLFSNIEYQIAFWAYYQKNDNSAFYKLNNLPNITVNDDYYTTTYEDKYKDAFTFVHTVKPKGTAESHAITLVRPFSQINVLTSKADYENAVALGSTPTTCVITLKGFANQYNLLGQTWTGTAANTTLTSTISSAKQTTIGGKDYVYYASEYLFGNGNADSDITVKDQSEKVIYTSSVSNLPLDGNKRTNLYNENLLTGGGVTYNITIQEEFNSAENGITLPVSVTATTAEELASFVNNATSDIVVTLANDIEGKISLTQITGINVTILGNGNKYTGGLHIWGNGANDDRSMTIKNINFDGTGLTGNEGCIYTTGAAGGKNSYACNVTIEDCTFTGAGIAAIRQNVAGERDWTIKNCTVANDMHSLLQVSNTNGELVVENCKVYSKNGANLNSTCVATFTDCEFDVQGYAVRVGVNSGGNPDATKVYTFTNCTFKSQNLDGDAVVIIRKDAEKATLKFVNTELNGNPTISGFTSDTKITGAALPQQANEIWYTSNEMKLDPTTPTAFNANIVSNVWDSTTGKGVITFDAPLTSIGNEAFKRITNTTPSNWATSITLPEGVTTIGNNAFYQCFSLTNITIPNSVTTIGQYAFNSCRAAKSVTIGSGVTSIASGAFYGCWELSEVICKSSTPPAVADKWVFYDCDIIKVIVPAGSVDAYKAAEFWKVLNIVTE